MQGRPRRKVFSEKRDKGSQGEGGEFEEPETGESGGTSSGLLRLYYTNAGGLYNKLPELRVLIETKNIDIICVTETHFHKDIEEAEIEIPGFNKFLANRNFKLDRSSKLVETSDKGGSIIYVRNTISILEDSIVCGPESLTITIETNVGRILLGCFYRSMSLNDSQNEEFLRFFSSAISGDSDLEKIIVGDFNCPNVSWLSGSVIGPNESVNKALIFQKQLIEYVHNVGLDWLITDEITRRRMVGNKVQESTIDQIFCTEESLVSEFSIGGPLGKSDHVSVITDLNVSIPNNTHCNDIDDVKRNWAKLSLNDILDLSYELDWAYGKNLIYE